MSPLLSIYLALSHCTLPFWKLSHRKRLKKGKETPERLPEKYGQYSMTRPEGEVFWFHALSVGESLALVPLIEKALSERPTASVVLSTSTATSQQALQNARLTDRCHHVLLPIDTPKATRRFLNHWRPNLAAFAELDFWPRLMVETNRAGIPMVLINSRMPEQNFERRKKLGKMMQDILCLFQRLLLQDKASMDRFVALGAKRERIEVLGALKTFARPLPADDNLLPALKDEIGNRPVWLAAATMAEEHKSVIEAHKFVLASHPDALLIIAPRHIADGEDAEVQARSIGLSAERRSAGQLPGSGCQVYVADTIGEMGLWYRIAPVSFIGHSLPPESIYMEGKNPFEAAALGSAILHGPAVSYFQESYEALNDAGGARLVRSSEELGGAVSMLQSPTGRQSMTEGAMRVIASGEHILNRTWQVLSEASNFE